MSFFDGFMTQWWLAMGVMGKIRDDCDINRVQSVTALLKSKAETVKNGNAARSDMLRAGKCPFLCPKCLKKVKRARKRIVSCPFWVQIPDRSALLRGVSLMSGRDDRYYFANP